MLLARIIQVLHLEMEKKVKAINERDIINSSIK